MISMLKMIIVEDEKLEREGLVDIFDWSSMDIKIVGTACDGIEGIALAQKTKPDIVITDIKMPGMNGLDMSKKVREILPQVKIIILTGYGDFNFAKKAIGISVSAYILKPIEEDEIIETVKSIVLECKKNENLELILNKEYYNEKSKFFTDLLQGKLKIEELKKNSLKYGINNGTETEFAIIKIKVIQAHEKLFKTFIFGIKNIIDKNISFLVSSEAERIIYICVSLPSKQDIVLENICDKIIKYIELIKLSFLIGIGTTVEHIFDIKNSADEASKTLDYGLFWYDTGAFYYKDIVNNIENKNHQLGKFISTGNKFSMQLSHAMACLEESDVLAILKELFEFINENKNVDKIYICNYLHKIIYEMSSILYSLNKDDKMDVNGGKDDFVTPMFELENLSLNFEYIYNFIIKVIKIRNEKRENKDEYVINNMVKLIEEKYMMGISLKIIAKDVYLSPNYIGHIFTKYMKKSFNDYLCEFRMAKAKELLEDQDKKISCVSREIGIPNTSYFCMLFKNIYGMAPKEYQEMMLRN